jgi:hypothetical protein
MGQVVFKGVKIPVTLRQSNRAAAVKAAQDLKERILKKQFTLTEPVGKIIFQDSP